MNVKLSGSEPSPFHQRTRVLDFGCRLESPAGRAQRWILWPTWAWRVIAPRPKRRNMNVFERMVLNLATAGKREAVAQAELLGLDAQLTALIIAQLQARGWLDIHGAPTSRGLRALEEDQPDHSELVSAYVFQDPECLELWPRFVEGLSFAEVDYLREDGFPRLLRGTGGNPRRESMHMAFPVQESVPPRPDVTEVLLAIHRSRRVRKLRAQEDLLLEDEGWEGSDPEKLSREQLSRVDFIDEQPVPYFLLSRVYFPETEAHGEGWRASDPFGTGDSLFLRQRIEEQWEADKRLQGLIADMVGIEGNKVASGLGELLLKLHDAAAERVKQELTLDIQRHEKVFRRLVAMERTWVEAMHAGQKCPQDKLEDVLSRAQKVLEHLFVELWRQFKNPKQARRLSLERGGRAFNEGIFTQAAKVCGFRTPLPADLCGVKGGKVVYAIEQGKGSLRPLLLGALLVAEEAPEHPLRQLAGAASDEPSTDTAAIGMLASDQQTPDMLERLDRLAALRDQTSHDSEHLVSIEEVQAQRQTVYDAVALLLGLPRKPQHNHATSQV